MATPSDLAALGPLGSADPFSLREAVIPVSTAKRLPLRGSWHQGDNPFGIVGLAFRPDCDGKIEDFGAAPQRD